MLIVYVDYEVFYTCIYKVFYFLTRLWHRFFFYYEFTRNIGIETKKSGNIKSSY